MIAVPLSAFAGGMLACGRRAGALGVLMFTTAGVLTGPLLVGMEEHAVPGVLGILLLSLWLLSTVAAITMPLVRNRASAATSGSVSNATRIATGLSSLLGSIAAAALAALVLYLNPMPSDFELGAVLLTGIAVLSLPLGAVLGWSVAKRRAAHPDL